MKNKYIISSAIMGIVLGILFIILGFSDSFNTDPNVWVILLYAIFQFIGGISIFIAIFYCGYSKKTALTGIILYTVTLIFGCMLIITDQILLLFLSVTFSLIEIILSYMGYRQLPKELPSVTQNPPNKYILYSFQFAVLEELMTRHALDIKYNSPIISYIIITLGVLGAVFSFISLKLSKTDNKEKTKRMTLITISIYLILGILFIIKLSYLVLFPIIEIAILYMGYMDLKKEKERDER